MTATELNIMYVIPFGLKHGPHVPIAHTRAWGIVLEVLASLEQSDIHVQAYRFCLLQGELPSKPFVLALVRRLENIWCPGIEAGLREDVPEEVRMAKRDVRGSQATRG